MGLLKQAKEPPQEAPAEEEAPAPEGEEAAPEAPEGGDETGWPSHLPPEQQDALEKGMTMLYDILYTNPQTSQSVLGQIPADPDNRLVAEGISRAAATLVQQIVEKTQAPTEVVPFIMTVTVDRLQELAEDVKGAKLSDTDRLAIMAATAAGVKEAMGGGGQPAPQQNAPAPGTMQ